MNNRTAKISFIALIALLLCSWAYFHFRKPHAATGTFRIETDSTIITTSVEEGTDSAGNKTYETIRKVEVK